MLRSLEFAISIFATAITQQPRARQSLPWSNKYLEAAKWRYLPSQAPLNSKIKQVLSPYHFELFKTWSCSYFGILETRHKELKVVHAKCCCKRVDADSDFHRTDMG
jgi:hypothetical protein